MAATTTTVFDGSLLIGTWHDRTVGVLVRFDEDGMHYVSYVESEPFEFGPYTLEGNRLTMMAEGGPGQTCEGPGVMDITFAPDGSWVFGSIIEDECAQRAASWKRSLTRYESDG